MDTLQRVTVTEDQIADFCQRWQVREFSLFGSILRDDFTDQSDVDVLVVFEGSYDLNTLIDMKEELEALFGREVDLIVKKNIETDPNPYRRKEILGSAKVIYLPTPSPAE